MKSGNRKISIFCFILLSVFISTVSSSTYSPTNMVVDFYSTTLSSDLNPGENGILNLVVENTGDFEAENVEVWISNNVKIDINKRFYIGIVKPGESKILPVSFKVDGEADTGLTGIQVLIYYDGYDADGDRANDKLTKWDIPVTIYGEPLFQIKPSKTTYFKDNVNELLLVGLAKTSLKDVETVLSSSCVTVIGSSKLYVGDVKADNEFNITYDIKPSETGACTVSIKLYYTDESGSRVYDNLSLGLIIEEAGVDFKIANISYDATGPGQTMKLKLSLKNVGKATAGDTTLSLSLSDPFTTADTAEKYVGRVAADETVEAEFNLAISWDAETKVYTIPLDIEYKVGGTSYSVEKDIGIDAGGQVILEIIEVESSRGSLQVDVANVGTRTAESVKATLIAGEGARFVSSSSSSQSTGQTGGGFRMMPGMGREMPTRSMDTGNDNQQSQAEEKTVNLSSQPQTYVAYKSDIKPTKQTTFTFDTSISGTAALILEYTGANNERIIQREQITVGGASGTSGITGLATSMGSRGSTGITTYLVYGFVFLIVAFIAHKAYKKWKS